MHPTQKGGTTITILLFVIILMFLGWYLRNIKKAEGLSVSTPYQHLSAITGNVTRS